MGLGFGYGFGRGIGGRSSLLNPNEFYFSLMEDGDLPDEFTGETYSVISGLAKNVPGFLPEKLTDPDIETWTDINTPAGQWGKYISGLSTVTREETDVYSGIYSAKVSIDASNSTAYLIASNIMTVGKSYTVAVYLKSLSGAPTMKIVNGTNIRTIQLTTTWQKYEYTFVANATYLALQNVSCISNSFFIDLVSVKEANYFALLEGNVNQTIISNLNIGVGGYNSRGGIAVSCNTATAPTSGIIAYHDLSRIYLYKFVNNVYTQLLNIVEPFVAGNSISIVKNGTNVSLFYGGIQKGATQTISDAQIVDNIYHGLYATDSYVGFIKFSKYAVNQGEVMLTFDDAYTSVYSEAYNYMQGKLSPGTVYVITNKISTENYATAEQLIEMYNAGWSIANHTNSHPVLTSLNQAQIEAELTTAKNTLNSLGLTKHSSHVAYPGGYQNATVLAAMAATGMLTGRVAGGTYVLKTKQFDSIYIIPSIDQLDYLSTLEELQENVNKAILAGTVCVFYIHDIVSVATTLNHTSIALFQAFVDWLVANGIKNISIEDFYKKIRP